MEAGAGRSFADNGDGTITDNVTRLMWEKKDDSGGIHDKDNGYSWSTGTNNMDGTIVTTFLATLNSGGGFAGHTDWRVPNRFELESLLNLESQNLATHPAFNTACAPGCTMTTCSCSSYHYWSSSTYAYGLPWAWGVFFDTADTNAHGKMNEKPVRAVRGGI